MKKRLLAGALAFMMSLAWMQGTAMPTMSNKALAESGTDNDIAENVTLDVDVSVDGVIYESGLNGVTYDITVDNTKRARGASAYYEKHHVGSSYKIDNIRLNGCFINAGSTSLEGILDGNMKVVIELTASHTYDSGAVFDQPTCTETGKKIFMCTKCGDTRYEDIPATGHNFSRAFIASSCNDSSYYADKCETCGVAKVTYTTDSLSYTDWSTTKPNIEESLIQTKTVYRYQDAVYDWVKSDSGTIDYASYKGTTNAYSYPNGIYTSSTLYKKYKNTPKTASTTATTKVTVTNANLGYIYWHWCRGTYTAGPINRAISSTKTATYPQYHEFYNTANYALDTGANARKCAKSDVCKDTYWWLDERVPIKRCTWTSYTWSNTGYGEWSDWQDEKVEGNDNRIVESTTMYRYASNSSISTDKHVYGEWVSVAGGYEKTCQICGDKVQEANPSDLKAQTHTHQFGNRQTVKEQSCTSYGIYKYPCTYAGCTAYEVSAYPSVSHTFTKTPNPATISNDGLITETCSQCGAESETIICKIDTCELTKTSLEYTGKELKPSAKVTDTQGTVLKADEDYTVTYAYNVDPGTAIATVTGIGNYNFSKQLDFTITKPVAKKTNKITASDITKVYSTSTQYASINATNLAGAKMTYSSNNSKVKVSSTGKVTIPAKFIGKATITIKAASTSSYNSATKTITVKGIPKAPSITKVSSPKKGTVATTWSKVSPITKYQIQFSKLKSFATGSKTSKIRDVSSSYTKSTLSGFSAGTWYVRVRTYKTVNSTKYYSKWSTVKYTKVK